MLKDLVEKRNEVAAKSAILGAAMAEAKTSDDTLDLTKVTKFGDVMCSDMSTVDKAAKMRELNSELTGLGEEIDTLAATEQAFHDQKRREKRIKGVQNDGGLQHQADPGERKEADEGPIDIGKQFTESEAYKSVAGGGSKISSTKMSLTQGGVKTLMTTAAGFAPQVLRTGTQVPFATRPIQVLDIFPQETTTQTTVSYMEETTFTNNAVEKAEGGAAGEAALAWTQRNVTIENLPVFLPVTEQQLRDESQIQSMVNNRLGFMVRQRADSQSIQGDGSTPNILGVLNKSGILTQAKGTDPVPDAIRKAVTKVRVTGRANPNVVLLHPNDYQDIRLLRTSSGIYIWGSPSEAGPARIWGLPIVESDVLTEGTGIVGDFANFSALVLRQDVELDVGFIDDDFKKMIQSIRANIRLAMVWYRPAAFATVTGI